MALTLRLTGSLVILASVLFGAIDLLLDSMNLDLVLTLLGLFGIPYVKVVPAEEMGVSLLAILGLLVGSVLYYMGTTAGQST